MPRFKVGDLVLYCSNYPLRGHRVPTIVQVLAIVGKHYAVRRKTLNLQVNNFWGADQEELRPLTPLMKLLYV